MNDTSVAIVGEYFRSQDGSVIHLGPCRQMGSAVRWSYADGLSLHSVAAFVRSSQWMRLCKRCWPAGALGVDGP